MKFYHTTFAEFDLLRIFENVFLVNGRPHLVHLEVNYTS